jgi:hypothetical protein
MVPCQKPGERRAAAFRRVVCSVFLSASSARVLICRLLCRQDGGGRQGGHARECAGPQGANRGLVQGQVARNMEGRVVGGKGCSQGRQALGCGVGRSAWCEAVHCQRPQARGSSGQWCTISGSSSGRGGGSSGCPAPSCGCSSTGRCASCPSASRRPRRRGQQWWRWRWW